MRVKLGGGGKLVARASEVGQCVINAVFAQKFALKTKAMKKKAMKANFFPKAKAAAPAPAMRP
jgi:hypothetical protein